MADGLEVDTRELDLLSVNIGRATAAGIAAAVPVVTKGLVNIKKDTRENISDHPSWKRLAQTVNYEQRGLQGEVGYEDVGQGELAGIHDFGSATRAPNPTLYPAADREAPRFAAGLAAAAGKAVEDTL
jgi:hypothetical protein